MKTLLQVINKKTGEVLQSKDMEGKSLDQINRIARGMSINMDNKKYSVKLETTA